MTVLDIVLKAVGVFALCFAAVYTLASLWSRYKARKRRRLRTAQAQERQKQPEKEQEKKSSRFSINKMDVILIIIAVTLFVFTRKMISLFETYGAIPDTLVTCVFGVCGGECGAMSWIKTSKEKHQDRRWQIEDEKRMEAAAKMSAASDDNDP